MTTLDDIARQSSADLLDVARRLFAQTDLGDSCWLWTGAGTGGGYGQISIKRRGFPIHRVAYELLVGPIPDGLELDHTCEIRNCINPAHLEPTTQYVNNMRSNSVTAINRRKTHCTKGHPLEGQNLYEDPRGYRGCRTCRADADARFAARRKKAIA